MIKLKNLSPEQVSELLPENLIFLAYRGSVAHGMYVPPSDPKSVDDKDLLGVFIAPVEHYLGFGRKDTYEKWINEYDTVHYELRKFFSLLLKSNPNVLSMLWVDSKHILLEHDLAKQLRENRDLFVSKKAYHSFTGYAYGQFKRMEQFEKQGYMGEKRKQLVSRFGYDTKNAAHLIRLLNMGIEFLTEGVLYVERKSDARHLLAIKNGEHSLEEVKQEAEHLFKLAKEAYVKSNLPAEPDRVRAEQLLMEMIAGYHGLV
ncbi:MAG: DNA polymerase beta superfamily protein [bacterium]